MGFENGEIKLDIKRLLKLWKKNLHTFYHFFTLSLYLDFFQVCMTLYEPCKLPYINKTAFSNPK